MGNFKPAISTSLLPLETSAATTNSHYYRPTCSAISSSTHSPTRPSQQFPVQSLLSTDPLLCHLTPETIIRLSTSGDFDFEPGEKAWSLRAAEDTVKVNEWLREVEGWNREWRRTYRESKDAGDRYLPPADRPEKRRKPDTGSIREDEEGAMLDGSKPVWWRLYSEENGTGGSGGLIVKDDTPEAMAVEAPKPQTDLPGLRRGGKPLTPYQLGMQRQRAMEARSEPDQILVDPLEKVGARDEREEESEEESEDEEEEEDDKPGEGIEYWGSLKRSIVEGYEARIELIKSEIEELDVDGLKYRVLCESGPSLPPLLTDRMLTLALSAYHPSAADLLTDSYAIMATTTLQLLSQLSRLKKLLSVWASRIAVLRIVPVFLRSLQIAKDALEAGYTAITHPSINPESSSLDKEWRSPEEESYTLMQKIITQKVATVGMLMDIMLDALEGREDVLPEKWIAELEDLEEGVGHWEMDGERAVLEGRLRLEEMIIGQSRIQEEAREREKTSLVLEQGMSAREARAEEEAGIEVQRLSEEEELAEKARLELKAEKVAEAKRLLLASEATQKEKAAELERLAEAKRQRLDAQRHEEESAAAKALEELSAIEVERVAVVEAAHQVFIREQAGFDDKKFQELNRQRRLTEDERARLADLALAEREEARKAKQQREREIEERVKVETSVFSSPTNLRKTMEEGRLVIKPSKKAVRGEISGDLGCLTSTSKNWSTAPRSSRPTLGKALTKDQKQRFTLRSSSLAPSTTIGYKVCIVSGSGSISADV